MIEGACNLTDDQQSCWFLDERTGILGIRDDTGCVNAIGWWLRRLLWLWL